MLNYLLKCLIIKKTRHFYKICSICQLHNILTLTPLPLGVPSIAEDYSTNQNRHSILKTKFEYYLFFEQRTRQKQTKHM